MNPREQFKRTECACDKCTKCCRYMPGSLIPGDLELILATVAPRDPRQWVLDHFQASEGAQALKIVRGQAILVEIPTIVPKLTETGCVFLKDGRCEIHEVAPFGCGHFDTHMSSSVAQPRSHAAAVAQAEDWQNDGSYAMTHKMLEREGRKAPPRRKRLKKLRKAWNRD